MIRICILVSLLVAGATGAASREVTVRSGEHDGYTRLVVQVPPDTGWVLTHRKNGARLSVAIDGVTFGTSSVFRRLSSNRLASVSQTQPGAALDLEFGCDCVASAFLYQQSMIVVDIAPGTVLPPLAFDIPAPVFRDPEPRDTSEVLGPAQAMALPLLNLKRQGFEDALSTRLLQGADRQILDLNLATAGPRGSVAVELSAGPRRLGDNVNLSTVLDDASAPLGIELQQIETEPVCISNVGLGFDSWTDTRPFPEQVADLRAGLFHEFDRIDRERAVALAKLYAFYGFGAEALQTLSLLEAKPDERERVAAIAALVDDQRPTHRNPFRGLQHCESDAALWAVLSERALSPDARLEVIEQSFVRLPDHLRRTLGPVLSSILVDAQELEAARRVLRAAERVESDTPPELAQAKAQVAQAEGDPDRAENLLTEVISAPDAATEAPIALARLVEKRWVDRGAVSPRELDLAASYAKELRRSEIGPLMARTHAIALSLNQQFDAALAQIQTLSDSADQVGALNRHLQVLAERSDDLTFLRQTVGMSQEMTGSLTTETAIALSDRLAALGFSAQARHLAGRPQDSIRRAERARLRARAALADDRPHQAMLDLSGDESPEALSLRVQALQATGDFEAAGSILRDLGETEAANRLFWLAGLGENVTADPVDQYAALNGATQTLSNPAERQPDKPLADAAYLLKDSAEIRQVIAGMMDAVQLP